MAETKKKAAAPATEEAAKKAPAKKPAAKKAASGEKVVAVKKEGTAKKAPAKKAAPAPEATEAPAPAVEEKKPAAKKPAAKKAPAKKAEPKEEPKPAKPAVTAATSVAKNVRVTPRKVRLVADVVRGKDVDEALAILSNLNKAASSPVAKVIKAAAADATHNFKLNEDKLYVAEIQVGDGMKMKRFEPRGKGSSSPLLKRCAHIRVTVKERK